MTANDYGLGLFNGDTGVVVADGDGVRAVVAGVGGRLSFATSRLSEVQTMHAMTIHKSQGSRPRGDHAAGIAAPCFDSSYC